MTQYVQEKIEKVEQPMTTWALLVMAVVLAYAYAYFINSAIANVVFAKETETSIAEFSSSISSMEGELFSAKAGINIEYARTMGFAEPAAGPVYILRQPSVSLSFNR